MNRKDAKSLSYDDATVMVVKQLMEHWKSRNIYTKTRKNVTAELKKHVKEYSDLLKLPDTSKGKPLSRYQKFNGKADKLFDIFSSDENRRKSEEEKCYIPMGAEEFAFLESMRADRSFTCGNIDTSWHNEGDAKLRREKKQLRNQYSSIDSVFTDHEISPMETEETRDIEIEKSEDECGFSNESDTEGTKERKRTRLFNDISITSPTDRSTRRLYSSTTNIRHTCNHIEHVRSSMNSLHDAIYETFTELDGHHFSYYESQLAIKIVAYLVETVSCL